MDIQTYIAQGKTEDALDLLAQITTDAVLLQSRFNGAKRQWNMGMIDHNEWTRTQNQINHAILEMYGRNKLSKISIAVNSVTLNYFNYDRKPGNDVGLVNKIFRTFKAMQEDMEFGESEIVQGVKMLNEIFGLPELVAKTDAFKTEAYQKNTEAFKVSERSKLVAEILKSEADFKETIAEIVAEEQKKTGWKEAFALLCQEPTKNRWDNTANLISERLQDPIFDMSLIEKWADMEADINTINDGLLWRRKFEGKLPDLKRFLQINLH